MFIVGYWISHTYPQPCAKLPFSNSEATPVLLFALAYMSFEKAVSLLLGIRVRGVFKSYFYDSLGAPSFLNEIPVVRTILQALNFRFIYKWLKSHEDWRFLVSITRVQSRITGYVCKMYTPVCLRRFFFGGFSRVYGVRIEEANRDRFEEYSTFTDFFTRTLKTGVRPIH